MTIWRRVACWISKATRVQAHSRARAPTHIYIRMHMRTHAPTRAHIYTQPYVILTVFPQQHWFRERASCHVIRTLTVLSSILHAQSQIFGRPARSLIAID
jgi:hypothetical protein